MDDKEYLAHYGIIGMKWGVRRYQNKDGSLTSAGKKRQASKPDISIDEDTTKKAYSQAKSSAKSVKRSIKKKGLKDMSDEELQAKLNRFKLEDQYLDAKDSVTVKSRSKGKSFALKCLERIGENVVVNIGTQAANHAIGVAINKAFKVDSGDTAKRIVNPQKGQSDKK